MRQGHRPAIAAAALAGVLALAALASPLALAQELEPVRYVLRIPAPATHYIEVQGTYPTSGKFSVELRRGDQGRGDAGRSSE